MKAGTRIEVRRWTMTGGHEWEPARIGRWMSYMGRPDEIPGYHPVRFDNGGCLMIHEGNFRVVSNG